MKKTWTEWWVEYEFIDTKYGKRPMYIKTFKTEAEARAFAETVSDPNVFETKCWSYPETETA